MSALMWAAKGGHASAVKALLDRGANISAVDDGGVSVLMW
eukprot:CAMPEP_0115692696 /NCGR_PEP_ID=MMETSP0272-20121206/63336_1 /TAXON_ID=71861 /ORGANISM="Scrippsiella trochoidea, Strain CCMP3099" /LENGTH=39 /DNA_ID= /DNA_START= /DNA_END= /DNA_ORIENTATION=